MATKNENVEIKTNEVNLDTVTSVATLTRKDWFAMFYEVFQMFEDNNKLCDYTKELLCAIDDATDVIIEKNRYEKDDNSVA